MKKLKAKKAIFTENVGIGEENPTNGLLHLRQSTNDAIRLQRSGSGVNDGNIYFGHSGGGLGISTSGAIGVTNPDFFISSSGNVGIGTTNPDSLLEVYSNSGVSNTQIHIHNDSTGNAAVLRLEGGRDTTNSSTYQDVGQVLFANKGNITAGIRSYHQGDGQASDNDFDDGDLRFLTSDHGSSNVLSTRMVIAKGGNVGIGTTNPSANLEIKGGSEPFVIYDANDEKKLRVFTSTNGTVLALADGGEDIIRLDGRTSTPNSSYFNGGNVGIGTTNPGTALEVSGAVGSQLRISRDIAPDTQYSEISGGGSTMTFKSVCSTPASATHSIFSFVSDNGTDELERMRIDAAGRIGIGTSSPSHKLHVADSSTMKLGSADDGTFNNLVNHSSRVGGSRYNNTHLPVHMMMHTSTSSESNLFFGWGTGSMDCPTKITFGTAANTTTTSNNSANKRMMIHSNGNVSIGADINTYKLYVAGSAFSTGTWGTSDDRLKHNEQTITGAIETLKKITPKKYIKTNEMYAKDHDFDLDSDGNPIDENGKKVEHFVEAGVIAQEVLSVDELAFAVNEGSVDEDGKETPHGLNYNSLFTYAIAAIQEQQAMIEDLKKEIKQLKS